MILSLKSLRKINEEDWDNEKISNIVINKDNVWKTFISDNSFVKCSLLLVSVTS